jgi:hypothetical protein
VEKTRTDILLDGFVDILDAAVRLKYVDGPTPENIEKFLAGLHTGARGPGMLALIEGAAAKFGGDYLAGGSAPTTVDYYAFALAEELKKYSPTVFDKTPTLAAWFDRFASRPNIKAYIDSAPPHRAV